VLMVELLITAALAAGAAPFEVHTLDGQSAAGQIAELNAEQLVLETDAGRSTFALSKLAVLARQPAPPISAAEATLSIELVDGTTLPATQFSVTKGTAKVRTTLDATHEIPTRQIRWVRFGSPDGHDPKRTKQWSEITEAKAAGDLLVVRTSDALDYLEGVVRDVDDAVCHFTVDDEVMPVKRAKIEGLVYAQPRGMELPEPIGKLLATDGSALQLQSVEFADGRLAVKTPAGTSHTLPLERVVRFDFSSGKVAYLSDLEPESADYTPLFGFEQPPAGLLEFYAYRRDVGFESNPLRLDGKVYKKGLSLASRTRLVYKLPGKFRVFRATVGIDDSVRETGEVRVEIQGDGKMLWQGDVRGSEPAHDLELKISGVRRLEILADYGEGLDVGDRLDLCEAQVTK
jgi:NPCBM/NEW2 domain